MYLQKNSKIIYLPAFLQGFLPGFSFAGLLAKAGIIQTLAPRKDQHSKVGNNVMDRRGQLGKIILRRLNRLQLRELRMPRAQTSLPANH